MRRGQEKGFLVGGAPSAGRLVELGESLVSATAAGERDAAERTALGLFAAVVEHATAEDIELVGLPRAEADFIRRDEARVLTRLVDVTLGLLTAHDARRCSCASRSRDLLGHLKVEEQDEARLHQHSASGTSAA